jgi:4,5-dihydroxyphthalate decarboxylase
MVRENAFDAGELAIVTFLQAKAYGKPYVLLPTPISGRFQHHCAGFNSDFGQVNPKDIEGKKVGVRTYTQTTALWIRGILRHEYGVDLDKVTWMTLGDGHLAEFSDPPNYRAPAEGFLDPADDAGRRTDRRPAGRGHAEGPARAHPGAGRAGSGQGLVRARRRGADQPHVRGPPGLSKQRPDIVRELYRMIVESRELTEGGVPKIFPPIGWKPTARASSWRSTGRWTRRSSRAACRTTNCSTT